MKTGLFLADTKARTLLEVESSNESSVRIYCCGPTVYRDAHVGNLRTFLLSDLIVRTLNFLGHSATLVQNITDVGHMSDDFEEDKMLAQSQLERRDPFTIAREYEEHFHTDLARLNISKAKRYPRASESIELMQALIEHLIELKSAYVGEDGSVYFSAQSFPTYGAISGNRLDDLKPGHRYEYTEDGAKRFHADWALWKAAGKRTEMIWPSPWGAGFPGWHIECSAMSMHFLGETVDLHVGGIDLRFPHHENERAQSNASIHNRELVSMWVHGEHLLFEGRKMSKSAGNVVLLNDLINKGLDPLALRLALMENRYRSQMDLTWSALEAANKTILRWRRNIAQWALAPRIEVDISDFKVFLANDLDTPKVILQLRALEKSEATDSQKYATFIAMDRVLALDLRRRTQEEELSAEARELLDARALARANKDFVMSDVLREKLQAIGIDVLDTPDGQSW